MCVFGDGEVAVVRQSERGSMIGLCSNHCHVGLDQINHVLYKKAERSFCKALIWGL